VAVGGGTCGVVNDGLDPVVWHQDGAGGVAPSIRLQQVDEGDALALGIARGLPDGFTALGKIRPPGWAGMDGRRPATCSFCSTLCLALSHCRERPGR
jgi:hypothetical protein